MIKRRGLNLSIKLSTCCLINLIIVILINLSFHCLLYIDIDVRYIRLFTGSTGLLWSLYCINKIPYTENSKFLFKYLKYVLVMISIELVYTYLKYSYQGILWTYYELSLLLIPLWGVPIFYLISNEVITRDGFIRFITWLTFASYVIRFGCHLYNIFRGKYIYMNLIYEYGSVGQRQGQLRIGAPQMKVIYIPMCIYLFCISKKIMSKIAYLFQVFIAVLFTAVVSLSRSVLIYQVIVIIVMYIAKKRTGKKKVFSYLFLLLIILSCILSPIINYLISFFDTFKTDSIYGVSTTIRLNAYKYYFGLIKNSPILGIGAVVGGNTIGNKILHGPYGLFFLDDVGLLAGVVRYGLLGIINYVLIFKNLCPFSTVYREEKSDYHTLLIGIYISMLIWGLNMDCYMLTNVIAMPIMFAIFTAYPECD